MPIWLPLLLAAPFVGSFLGVVITRDAGPAVLRGRSRCDACGATLSIRDLVPLLSWIALARRCRSCGERLPLFYPTIELAAAVPVVWAATEQNDWLLVASAILGWLLLALAWIDWRTFRLPDVLTLPLLATGLIASWFFDRDGWTDHIAGAIAGFLIIAALAAVYRIVRRQEGMGLGDAKLTGALGAWIAWQGLPSMIFLAALLGLCWTLLRAALRKPVGSSEPLPFGPFLAAAGWIVWLYGPLTFFTRFA